MKKLLALCICVGGLPVLAMAGDPYEDWINKQKQRGTEIEIIRVASEKPVVDTEETDAEVASILEEVEAIEVESADHEDDETSSS